LKFLPSLEESGFFQYTVDISIVYGIVKTVVEKPDSESKKGGSDQHQPDGLLQNQIDACKAAAERNRWIVAEEYIVATKVLPESRFWGTRHHSQ
jgi:hypothetical protein